MQRLDGWLGPYEMLEVPYTFLVVGFHTLIPSALGLFGGFGSWSLVQTPGLLGKERQGYTLALGADCHSSRLFSATESISTLEHWEQTVGYCFPFLFF